MNVKMDQKIAQKLFRDGGFFILLNLPEGTEFGIDLKLWNTGEKFRGIKMIPPGLHYIFYSSVSNGETAPRTGFFHYFRKSEVLVRKWDKDKESLSFESIPEEEIVGLKENMKVLDSFLGPYPYDILARWKNLTSNVSENIVKKLIPLKGEVRSALELEGCTNENRKDPQLNKNMIFTSKRLRVSLNGYDDDFLPDLKPREGTDLRFSSFPNKSYPDGSSPSEITKYSLDFSYLFEQFILNYETPQDILGELEFCYICFLVGHSLEAFEQWKRIVGIFCSCDDAIKKHRRIYDEFLTVIELQIKEIPVAFLADIVVNNNFVYTKLRELFRFVRGSNVDSKLKCKADRLRQKLTELYKWDFSHLESEDEEDAPVIVQLD